MRVFMFVASLKAAYSSFQKDLIFCHSKIINLKKVIKLGAFIFEHPSYNDISYLSERQKNNIEFLYFLTTSFVILSPKYF